MQILIIALLTLCAITQPAWSRPVSYPGGVTLDFSNNGDQHSALLHYSPSAKYSVGFRTEYRRGGDYTLTGLQLNNLIKRWNKKDSQANFYIKSGIGFAERNSSRFTDDSSFSAFTGIAADWESRRFFTSYENRYIKAGALDDFFVQKIRLGIAPYLADYGSLHTWFMLELEHEPEDSDTFTVTPLLRFLKDVHLLEVGVSDDNDVLFNWTIRF